MGTVCFALWATFIGMYLLVRVWQFVAEKRTKTIKSHLRKG